MSSFLFRAAIALYASMTLLQHAPPEPPAQSTPRERFALALREVQSLAHALPAYFVDSDDVELRAVFTEIHVDLALAGGSLRCEPAVAAEKKAPQFTEFLGVYLMVEGVAFALRWLVIAPVVSVASALWGWAQ